MASATEPIGCIVGKAPHMTHSSDHQTCLIWKAGEIRWGAHWDPRGLRPWVPWASHGARLASKPARSTGGMDPKLNLDPPRPAPPAVGVSSMLPVNPLTGSPERNPPPQPGRRVSATVSASQPPVSPKTHSKISCKIGPLKTSKIGSKWASKWTPKSAQNPEKSKRQGFQIGNGFRMPFGIALEESKVVQM